MKQATGVITFAKGGRIRLAPNDGRSELFIPWRTSASTRSGWSRPAMVWRSC